MIDTRKAMEKSKKQKTTGLVSKEYELVRRDRAGEETVIAEGVMSYDVGPDQSVVYTDGNVVFRLDSSGETHEVCRDHVIEKVVAVG